jgi:hypothetical protein
MCSNKVCDITNASSILLKHADTIRVSRSGNSPIEIRYTEYNRTTWFCADDTIDPFLVHADKTFADVWANDFTDNIRLELGKSMYIQTYASADADTGQDKHVSTMMFPRNNIIKIILLLPIPFEDRSSCLELFLLYYKAHFRSLRNIHKTPLTKCCIKYQNPLLLFSFVVGFVTAIFIFTSFRMLRTQ